MLAKELLLIGDHAAAWLMLVGRISVASVFLVSGIHKAFWYQKAVDEFRESGVSLISVMLPATIALHLIGSVCLIVGYQTRLAALLLAVFTIVATLKVHAFWRLPEEQQLPRSRVANANLAVLGGLLIFMATGPGALALMP